MKSGAKAPTAAQNIGLNSSRTVLVVDESPTTVKIHKFLLSKLGFEVLDFNPMTENTENELISFVKQTLITKNIDVILLSSLIKDSNGPLTTKRLRKLGYSGLIIAVTSNSDTANREKFLHNGANNFVVKPLSESKLRAVLKGLTIDRQQEVITGSNVAKGINLLSTEDCYRSKTVLIVDESKSTVKLHAFTLLKLGFNIAGFHIGSGSIESQLLTYVRENLLEISRNTSSSMSKVVKIDIILLSSVMRDSDGPQTTQRLRRLGYKGLIFAVTSNSDATDRERFLENGANAYIVKPLTEAKLVAALEGSSGSIARDVNKEIEADRSVTTTQSRIDQFRIRNIRDKDTIAEMRVLLLDDSAVCRKINHAVLAKFGHTVIDGNCGMVGLNLVRNALTAESYGATGVGYEMILISNVMKGMSGPHATLQLREAGYQGFILGLVTHTSHESVIQEFKDSGADGVLCKPFRIGDLNEYIKDLCFPERLLAAAAAAAIQDSAHQDSNDNSRAVAVTAAKKDHMKVLVVDESGSVRHIHERLLSQEGHVVVCAASGSEGVNAVRKAKIEVAYGNTNAMFDVVTVSHLMAGMTGFQTIANIRAQGFRGVIMVVTSESSSREIISMRESGADCVVAKPLKMKSFKRALRDFVNFLTNPMKIKDSHVKKWEAVGAAMSSEELSTLPPKATITDAADNPAKKVLEAPKLRSAALAVLAVARKDTNIGTAGCCGDNTTTTSMVSSSALSKNTHEKVDGDCLPPSLSPPSPRWTEERTLVLMQAAAERRIMGRDANEHRSTQHRLVGAALKKPARRQYQALGSHLHPVVNNLAASGLTECPAESAGRSFAPSVSVSVAAMDLNALCMNTDDSLRPLMQSTMYGHSNGNSYGDSDGGSIKGLHKSLQSYSGFQSSRVPPLAIQQPLIRNVPVVFPRYMSKEQHQVHQQQVALERSAEDMERSKDMLAFMMTAKPDMSRPQFGYSDHYKPDFIASMVGARGRGYVGSDDGAAVIELESAVAEEKSLGGDCAERNMGVEGKDETATDGKERFQKGGWVSPLPPISPSPSKSPLQRKSDSGKSRSRKATSQSWSSPSPDEACPYYPSIASSLPALANYHRSLPAATTVAGAERLRVIPKEDFERALKELDKEKFRRHATLSSWKDATDSRFAISEAEMTSLANPTTSLDKASSPFASAD